MSNKKIEMASVGKIFLLINCLLILIFPYSSYAKCGNITKRDFINSIPIFVQGSVANYKPPGAGEKKNSFKIQNLKVLKGNIEFKSLAVEYENVSTKPAKSKLENNKIYIFPVLKLENDKAEVSLSSCNPNLEIADFTSKNLTIPIKNKSTALQIAKIYYDALTEEKSGKNMEFTAEEKNDEWVVQITEICIPLMKCEKRMNRLVIEKTGKLIDFNY